ncbi:hypothetical protein D3C85_1420900 [compost metagenome]
MFVDHGHVDAAGGQRLHQLLLLAIANAYFHPGPALLETGDQAWQVQRCHGFKTTDVDLSRYHVVVRQGVLLELMGDPQQLLGLAVEPRTARRQRHPLGVMADEQLHAKTLFQVLDCRRHRGLRDVELARGLRHAAAVGRGDEIPELAQVVGGHGNLRKTEHQGQGMGSAHKGLVPACGQG